MQPIMQTKMLSANGIFPKAANLITANGAVTSLKAFSFEPTHVMLLHLTALTNQYPCARLLLYCMR